MTAGWAAICASGVGYPKEIAKSAVGGGLSVDHAVAKFADDDIYFSRRKRIGANVAKRHIFSRGLQRFDRLFAGIAGGYSVKDHGVAFGFDGLSPYAVKARVNATPAHAENAVKTVPQATSFITKSGDHDFMMA